ncbi:MAG: NUMOD4 motif-containing HNH endonuclease [Methanosarcina sp.]
MIPFKKVNSLEDVKKAYPSAFDKSLLNFNVVKNFVPGELDLLIEDEIDRCLWAEEKPKSRAALALIYTPVAQAKALYHFLWSIDHVTDQMVKWGWDPKDISTLMKRMQKKGYDPYSIDEDTAGKFIESLKGFGFKKIETRYGDEFYLYDPSGYGENKTKTTKSVTEVWKTVKDLPNYEVSNCGRVASVRKGQHNLMKLHKRADMYMDVRLCQNGVSRIHKVHRLVAEAFIPNPAGKPQVNHINGVKDDNNVSNLEWVTSKENIKHAYITGLAKPTFW